MHWNNPKSYTTFIITAAVGALSAYSENMPLPAAERKKAKWLTKT